MSDGFATFNDDLVALHAALDDDRTTFGDQDHDNVESACAELGGFLFSATCQVLQDCGFLCGRLGRPWPPDILDLGLGASDILTVAHKVAPQWAVVPSAM